MTHNDFKMMEDVVIPMKNFIRNCDLSPSLGNNIKGKININPIIFRKPKKESDNQIN